MEVHPALSPDGRFLAYAGGNPLQTRVYVRQVSGGRPALLTDDSTAVEVSPSWSPDGTRILFANQHGLFSVSASGGAPRQEAPARAAGPIIWSQWSPDGQTIAYVVADSIFLKADRRGAPVPRHQHERDGLSLVARRHPARVRRRATRTSSWWARCSGTWRRAGSSCSTCGAAPGP